ncbi:hypothetical protein T01_11736 [Trichinella spiralis]|uniref:Uncharacterized protein n=1 Tax=Trichinella spiralis TaxID=6334 RepID=A0A0V1BWB4_TRISP|nr:hypothetical protein T01_11736 [Trichinella spiralis]
MLKLTSRPRRQALNSQALATLLNNLASDNIPVASKYCQIIENFSSMLKFEAVIEIILHQNYSNPSTANDNS